MFIENSYKRLTNNNFFRIVDKFHNKFISDNIEGGKILDLGCGYGSLVDYLNRNKGFDSIGIDTDEESIRISRKLFPENTYENFSLNDNIISNTYDYIILKDVLHHLKEEGKIDYIFKQIRRILKKEGRVIIFDPNVNLILKVARKIMKHKDAECTFKDANTILKDFNFEIIKSDFIDLFAIPLSGGYVGICFVPKIIILQKFLILCNKVLSDLISKTFLKKYFLWRYFIIAIPK
jgi:2-polyprenyl-3-methyl-5-hydroxy-6-metoxy-1,4-benzoquinol methylase